MSAAIVIIVDADRIDAADAADLRAAARELDADATLIGVPADTLAAVLADVARAIT